MMDHRREWRSGVDCNWRSREDLIWRVLAQSPVRTQKASLSLSIFSGFFVKWCATSYVVDTFSSSHLCYATSPFRRAGQLAVTVSRGASGRFVFS